MPKQDEPRCETCDRFDPDSPNRPGAGTCGRDGMIVDTKSSCWFHSDKVDETDKKRDDTQ